MDRRKGLIIIFCLVIFAWPVRAGPPPDRDWKTILVQLQAGDYQKTIHGLKVFLDSNPETLYQKRALFLLAHAYRQADKPREAEDYFSRAMKIYDRLRDYIELELGKIWLAQGKPHRVYELIKSFTQKYPKSPLLYDAQLLEAHSLKDIGDYSQAINKYRTIIEGEGVGDRQKEAEAIFGWAESLAKSGQLSQAFELYRRLYFDYPEQRLAGTSWREMNILEKDKTLSLIKTDLELYIKRADKLTELGYYSLALKDHEVILGAHPSQGHVEKTLLQKAFCLSKLKERTKAIVLLEQFVDKYPHSRNFSQGLYYLARLYWHSRNHDRAEGVIHRLIKAYPDDSWSEKGMLILGLMKEEEGRWSEARKIYQDIKRRFPKGEMLPEVYWRWGWSEYLVANYDKASEVFNELALLPNGEKLKDKAIYWGARALEKTGQEEKAQGYYEELARNYPYSYYGIKGEERHRKGQKGKDNFSFMAKDNTITIPENISWTAEQSYYLERIRELSALTLYAEVEQELRYLLRIFSRDLPYQYYLAKFFYQNGSYYKAIKILSQLLRETPVKDRNKLPAELWQLFYPLAYWSQVNYQAKQNHQNPYLIMSIIRQESAFQAGIISSAGACGLMQILPSTGRFISQSIDKDDFQRQYLFDPDMNISLGIWYFNYLQKKFDENLILALAGYNAGPAKVKEWLKNYSMNDPEEFIENIPYDETRDYVKNILRNQSFYQKVYGK